MWHPLIAYTPTITVKQRVLFTIHDTTHTTYKLLFVILETGGSAHKFLLSTLPAAAASLYVSRLYNIYEQTARDTAITEKIMFAVEYT